MLLGRCGIYDGRAIYTGDGVFKGCVRLLQKGAKTPLYPFVMPLTGIPGCLSREFCNSLCGETVYDAGLVGMVVEVGDGTEVAAQVSKWKLIQGRLGIVRVGHFGGMRGRLFESYWWCLCIEKG